MVALEQVKADLRILRYTGRKAILKDIMIPLALIVSIGTYGQWYEIEFTKRGDLIVTHTADFYKPPSLTIGDPEKYYWPFVIARFEKYVLRTHWQINRTLAGRSPFHFTLVGMARILFRYREAPFVKDNYKLILHQ